MQNTLEPQHEDSYCGMRKGGLEGDATGFLNNTRTPEGGATRTETLMVGGVAAQREVEGGGR